jgi:threonine dehydrogenase-like Zn-dependent dehydrogenase
MERGIRLIGNGQAPVHLYWEELLKKIQSGDLDPLHMVTHRYDIADFQKIYQMFDAREKGVQKIFVQTKFSDPPAQGCPELTKL